MAAIQLSQPKVAPDDAQRFAAALGVGASSVARALARLPVPARTILMLVAVEGFSHAEAAHLLDIPEGTVASRLHHARARLRAALG